jgi:hypothetical protein
MEGGEVIVFCLRGFHQSHTFIVSRVDPEEWKGGDRSELLKRAKVSIFTRELDNGALG